MVVFCKEVVGVVMYEEGFVKTLEVVEIVNMSVVVGRADICRFGWAHRGDFCGCDRKWCDKMVGSCKEVVGFGKGGAILVAEFDSCVCCFVSDVFCVFLCIGRGNDHIFVVFNSDVGDKVGY